MPDITLGELAFLSIHAAVYNAFYVQRHLLTRRVFKAFRTESVAV
jgi:hypothetical protein